MRPKTAPSAPAPPGVIALLSVAHQNALRAVASGGVPPSQYGAYGAAWIALSAAVRADVGLSGARGVSVLDMPPCAGECPEAVAGRGATLARYATDVACLTLSMRRGARCAARCEVVRTLADYAAALNRLAEFVRVRPGA